MNILQTQEWYTDFSGQRVAEPGKKMFSHLHFPQSSQKYFSVVCSEKLDILLVSVSCRPNVSKPLIGWFHLHQNPSVSVIHLLIKKPLLEIPDSRGKYWNSLMQPIRFRIQQMFADMLQKIQSHLSIFTLMISSEICCYLFEFIGDRTSRWVLYLTILPKLNKNQSEWTRCTWICRHDVAKLGIDVAFLFILRFQIPKSITFH